jgi:hypothetical protein
MLSKTTRRAVTAATAAGVTSGTDFNAFITIRGLYDMAGASELSENTHNNENQIKLATVRTGRVQTAIGTSFYLTLTIGTPIVIMRNTNETLPHKTETLHEMRPEQQRTWPRPGTPSATTVRYRIGELRVTFNLQPP